jgi:hypothetical protein
MFASCVATVRIARRVQQRMVVAKGAAEPEQDPLASPA